MSIAGLVRRRLPLPILARIVSQILFLLVELILVLLVLEVTANRDNLLAFQPRQEITGMELLTLVVLLEPFLLQVQVRWTLVSRVARDFTAKRDQVIAHLVKLDLSLYLIKLHVVSAQRESLVDLRQSSALTVKVVSSTALSSRRLV